MTEQKDEQEEVGKTTKETETKADTPEGDNQGTTPVIDNANAAAERMEKANEKKEELLKKEEALMAKKTLGGRGEAGVTPIKPEEETPKEYKDRVLSGKLEK